MLAVRPAHRVCTSPSTLPAAGCRKCSAAEPLLADNSCGAEQQDKGGLAKFFSEWVKVEKHSTSHHTVSAFKSVELPSILEKIHGCGASLPSLLLLQKRTCFALLDLVEWSQGFPTVYRIPVLGRSQS